MRAIIVGTGGMAAHHVEHLRLQPGTEIVAAVDVDPVRVKAFAEKHDIAESFTSLDAVIGWGKFDAASNVTPDRIHHPTTMALLAAGKHVMCEKPLAENYRLAAEMADAAEKAGVVNMVNLTYRNVAALEKARTLVLSGAIGDVRHVEASYLQSWLVSKQWGDWQTESQWLWRLSTAHGSNGVLGDIGIHILDFASYGAALDIAHISARLKTFQKAPDNRIGDYVLDANDSFAMAVDFTNGALGVIHASRWATGHLNDLRLRIYGTRGGLEVNHNLKGSSLRGSLGDDAETASWTDIAMGLVKTNYQRFAEAVKAGVNQEPSFRHAAQLQKALDLGIVADRERKEQPV